LALIDNFSGKILFDLPKSDLCQRFHHNHPEISKNCLKTNFLSISNIHDNIEPSIIRCPNGYVESLIPIIVNEIPVATIFAGMLDFNQPDLEFFKDIAKRYGFDENEYLDEVKKIPVINKDFFLKHLEILNKFSNFITLFFYQHSILKETEHELIKEKKFFNDMFNAVNDGISVLDKDLNIIKTNAYIEKLHFDKMPVVGKKCFDVYHGLNSFCSSCPVKASFITKSNKHAITTIDSKGQKLWFELHAYPIIDDNGEVQNVIEFCRDITHHKKTKDLLKEERNLFLNGPVVVFKSKAAPGCPVMHVSKNVSQFGYEKNDLENGKILFADIVHPDDIERISQEALNGSKHSSGCFEQEYRIITKNNEIRWVYDFTLPIRDDSGTIIAYHGYIIDMTDKKETENALRISEERFKYAISAIEDGLWDWNIYTGDVYFSSRWKKMLGYDENDIEPNVSSWEKLIHPEDMGMVMRVLNYHLAGKTSVYETEHRVRTKNGEWKWILDKGKVVEWNAEGKPLRAVGTHRDITQLKEAQSALKNAGLELEKKVLERTEELKNVYRQLFHAEKLGAIGRLSASIAHEFNNPLFGVMNVLTEMRLHKGLNEEEKELVNLALNECGRMKSLIKDLMDFNRPSSGEMKLNDLIAIIENILKFCKKDLSNKNITLKTIFKNPQQFVQCVADQIKQVLLNIISNAIDACEPKGMGNITIQEELAGDFILLSIEDDGVGIPSLNIDKIFEPFFSTKPEVKGTGLGLSVSYGIIKAHGWNIDVESRENIGSKFIIKIPV